MKKCTKEKENKGNVEENMPATVVLNKVKRMGLVGNVRFLVASIQKQDPASGGDFVALMEPIASIFTISMFSEIARLSECLV